MNLRRHRALVDAPPVPRAHVKVAMLVLNPGEHDARVRRSARTLAERGYDVRVFALGNSTWPAGTIEVDGFTIERVEVRSIFVRWMAVLRRLYRAVVGMLTVLAVVAAASRRRRRPRPLTTDERQPAQISFRSALRTRGGLKRWASRGLYLTYRRSLDRVRQGLRTGYLRAHRFLRRLLLPLHRPSVVRCFREEVLARLALWQPDVVHCHDANTLIAGEMHKRDHGALLIYDSHELWRHRNRGGELRPLERIADAYVERRGIAASDAVITVSGGIADWLQRRYRLPTRPVVLRNIPATSAPALDTPAPELRTMAGLGTRDVVVLYTGRITTGRGIGTMIEALARLPSHHHLVLLGYGTDDDLTRLGNVARRHDVTDRVHHVGAVPSHQVAAVASTADIAFVGVEPVCLSYRLCLPNKLFEAIQGHLPIVASDLPEVRSIVHEFGIGRVFAPGDVAGAAKAVREVAGEGSYRAAVYAAGGVLHWGNEQRRLIELYADLTPVFRPARAAVS